MRHRLRDIWTYHKIPLMALLVLLGLAGFFGTRTVLQMAHWSDPANLDQPLQGWMTPRYVAQSYDVPPEVVQGAFDLTPPRSPRRRSLARIAEDQNVTLDELQSRLDAAVAAFRAGSGP